MNDHTTHSPIYDDLRLLHRAFDRGLDVALERCVAFQAEPPADPGLLQGYADVLTALCSGLNAHHSGEEHVLYPALRPVLPGAPYAQLVSDHLEVGRLIEALRHGNAHYAEDVSAGLAEIHEPLQRLHALWAEHAPLEERVFSAEAVNAVMDREEQERVSVAWAEHAIPLATPPWLTMPFVVHNLEGQNRADFAAGMPPEIIDHLIPVVWADLWRPMKPFLLD